MEISQLWSRVKGRKSEEDEQQNKSQNQQE